MKYLLVLVAAMVVSMVVIPVMMRFASRLGLIDQPDPRKVHARPTPRVGGWGIVLGALVAILMVIPFDKLLFSYLFGSIVLFIFGVWDDKREVGHYVKFIGQFIAVLTVVFYGNLYVTSFPFIEDIAIPSVVSIPFTVLAMVGVINAINHSDGLDGLAGGLSLFSLIGIAFLSYLVNGDDAITIALAVTGGVFGFLRYNTHPAVVFMGDSGSQFLGFTLGFLVILLTQRVDPELSPAVTLLLFGLPVIDILAVLIKRIKQGLNWFRATKNHIHHRLLDLDFTHQETVVIIYSLQVFLVVSGILLRYSEDWIIISIYLAVCAFIFSLLTLAERKGWKAHQQGLHRHLTRLISRVTKSRILIIAPRRFLAQAIPIYLIVSSFLIDNVPFDVGAMSMLVFALMVLQTVFGNGPHTIERRALIYVTATFIVYLGVNYPPMWFLWRETIELIFFSLIAMSTAVAIKSSPGRRKLEFRVTATDYLVVFILLASIVTTNGLLGEYHAIVFIVKLAIIFYSCELLLSERREGLDGLNLSSLATMMVLSVRGLL